MLRRMMMAAGGGAPPGGDEHLYWRILITETRTGDSFLATIAEVEMRATAGGADLCSGGTASASSQEATYPASKAFDNLTGVEDIWVSGSGQPSPQWLQYQFAAPVEINEVLIRAASTTSRAERAPRSFKIQWSDDGTTWTDKWAVTDTSAWAINESRVYSVDDAPGGTPHLYWRVYLTAVQGGGTNVCSIGEIEMRLVPYGPDQASGGTALSSSDYSGYPASQAFDNNGGTRWSSNTGAPMWVGYQFAAAVSIKQVLLVAPDAGNYASVQMPKDFAIEWSDDGTTWNSAVSYSGITTMGISENRVFAVPET